MLVFDLDDTLYLERDFAFSGYRFLEQVVLEETGHAGFGALCRELFEVGERHRIFDLALERLGVPASSERIAALVKTYRAHPPDISLCPDASRYLGRTPGPFGLITDGPAPTQIGKIAALGLEQRIEHIRVTGTWGPGYGKPHPRAYEEMERHGPKGSRMVYVADNPAKDFVTPNARGWLTVQIRREGGVHCPVPPRPDYAAHVEIRSLDDLDSALRELE